MAEWCFPLDPRLALGLGADVVVGAWALGLEEEICAAEVNEGNAALLIATAVDGIGVSEDREESPI